MITSIASCAVTAGWTTGFHANNRRHGDRRQAVDRRKPEAASPKSESQQPGAPNRGPGRPGLGDTLRTLAPMATATRMTEAARAFSAGNCFLSGTLIDRCI